MEFQRKKPHNDEIFLSRISLLQIIIIIAFCLILLRIFQLTVISGKKYYELSENNFLIESPIEASRGVIYDRIGRVLATNKISFSLYLSPSKMEPKEILPSLIKVESILGKDLSEIKNHLKEYKGSRKNIIIASNLRFDKSIPLLENLYDLDGIFIKNQYNRYYPYKEKACHIIGYVGKIPPSKEDHYAEKGYNVDEDVVGLYNVESEYEQYLRGQKGNELILRDSRGRIRNTFINNTAVPGNNLYLTIDSKFQEYVQDMLAGKVGCAIAMNPKDGSILALASSPDFNPNNIALSLKEPPASFVNKGISENYPPGSIIKPIIASIALDRGFSRNREYLCTGEYFLPNYNRGFKCDFKPGHGLINMDQAIKSSCNMYFFQLTRDIGKKALLDYFEKWGLGLKTGIDLNGEITGSVPQPGEKVFPGNLIQLGIGQGPIALTPIQVITAYAAIANNGLLFTPHILDRIETEDGKLVYKFEHIAVKKLPLEKSQANFVKKALTHVVYEVGGTAYHVKFDENWHVAGKTGTAQTGRKDEAHSWFVCFAPVDDPQIACVVIVEQGGFGSMVAAPIVRNMLDYYFNKMNTKDTNAADTTTTATITNKNDAPTTKDDAATTKDDTTPSHTQNLGNLFQTTETPKTTE